ncbi:MAG: hypothetical protein Q8Q32_03505 [bacterium]|nr:hypothetical protein [bacterium]
MYKIVILICAFALIVMPVANAAGNGGYDQWGYNYRANIFNGYYENFSKPVVPVTSSDWWLQMKWNDAWLDQDGNRHEGYPSYLDSGAWLTNHIRSLSDERETYFVKIVAAKSSWTLVGPGTGGSWYDASNNFMGESIWNEFYIAQEVESGTGLATKAPAGPGLGNN